MMKVRGFCSPSLGLLAMIGLGCATGVPPQSDSMGDTEASFSASEPTTSESMSSTTEETTEGTTTEDASTDPTTTAGSDSDTDTEGETDTDGEMIDLDAPKQRIYQLTVRTFSNTKTGSISDGGIDSNGVGKFAEINDVALGELRALGFSHIWLHGVLQQATATDYNSIGEPADDPDAIRGKAGSYYAIRDYYDVSPDYAEAPTQRLQEFDALVDRIHGQGMKVLIDLVPNHVARTYHTTIPGKIDLGLSDERSVFSWPEQNHFFYLVEPPGQVLMLPKADWWTPPGEPDGTILQEDGQDIPPRNPRATGNNVASATPAVTDWYDTIKLNFGYNFVAPEESAYNPQPKAWAALDDVIAYWQERGVDGFRVHQAAYVPTEFWTWAIGQAKARDPEVIFIGEVALNEVNAAPETDAITLLEAGFTAMADVWTYDAIKNVFCCTAKASEITNLLDQLATYDPQVIRFSENDSTRRIASPVTNGDPTESGFGSGRAGLPASALLFLLGRGPIVVHNGQEVGEPGSGVEGYGREDGRTTIFDYWTMPELAKWVNEHNYDGGQLGASQRDLREDYARLIALSTSPAIASGEFVSLQEVNQDSSTYCSTGRWCYTFLRYVDDEILLITANLNPNNLYTLDLKIPQVILDQLGVGAAGSLRLVDRMDPELDPIIAETERLTSDGVKVRVEKSQVRVFKVTAE